jgi:hypothetical protein
MSDPEKRGLGPRDDGSSSYEYGFEAARATPSERERELVDAARVVARESREIIEDNHYNCGLCRAHQRFLDALKRYDEEVGSG